MKKDKIYTNLGEVVSAFTYRDFIYFMFNLGMDYYDGLNVMSREEWEKIFTALKENYTLYEKEKKINYRQFRANMADILNEVFHKHRSAYNVMYDALISFGVGTKDLKMKYLISDLEEQEAMAKEFT